MRRVLVIDDHEPSRRNLLRALAESGFEVAGEGASGAGALELSLATNPEVILMAVGLADMDGIRAARRIMQAHPLPIILLTSHFDAVTIERAKRAGIMGYLIKPLRGSELASAIELAVAHFEEFIALRKENDNLKKTLEARKIIERANTASSKRTSKRCSFKRRAKARFVRLKGGDPFVCGRGGEEAEALSAAGIPYEIVPGVSSAIAAPAYTGIPVTHRSCASSLAIVTCHEAHNGCGEVKWRDLARSVDTIVILMGLQNLRESMKQLLEGGCEPGRPVAVIQSGTRPSQRTLVATVATIADLVEGAEFKSPTLIVVGEVVDFRLCLQWRESIIRDDTLVAGCEALEATPWTYCV